MLETDQTINMNLLNLIKSRRSIRRYTNRQITEHDLRIILDAGAYAPNAGGGQRTMFIACQDIELNQVIGKLNVSCMDRRGLVGNYVSVEQPSIIDDPSIKSGFYGAPTVITIFGPKDFLYSIPDAFCVAENMVLQATALGIASCILARGEETFSSEEGRKILENWEIPQSMIARCFVILGYVSGDYPQPKPRKINRYKIIK